MTDLEALKSENYATRTNAFASLKAETYVVCYKRLQRRFPGEIEDVVLESLKEIYEKIDELKTNEDLAKLTQRIAENHAISCWRSMMTKKRGEGKVQSLDALQQLEEGKTPFDPPADIPRLSNLDLADIRRIIDTLQGTLKLEYKQALNDYIINQLSFEEISQRRGWPLGSVGVYVQRGLKAMRDERVKYPKLMEAAAQYILMLLV